jgi:hypothetical protein
VTQAVSPFQHSSPEPLADGPTTNPQHGSNVSLSESGVFEIERSEPATLAPVLELVGPDKSPRGDLKIGQHSIVVFTEH